MSLPAPAGGDSLAFVGARAVAAVLRNEPAAVRAAVKAAYLLHGAGHTVNPPTQALRFPDRPSSRILSLVAHIGGPAAPLAGMKWISSFPENLARGLPRASAIVILNDPETGRPFACLEGSHVSAARTAASAVLAAEAMGGSSHQGGRLAICGAGFIARHVWWFLQADGWQFESVEVFDLDVRRAERFAAAVAAKRDVLVRVHRDLAQAVRESNMVVFTTTALVPHVGMAELPPAPRVVLHLSLRDLEPEVMLGSQNFVDDIEHAFRDGTSLALAKARAGSDGFLPGSLYDLLQGTARFDPSTPRIFSPFGLGVLDVAVAGLVYQRAIEHGSVHLVPDFFSAPAEITTP